MGGAPLQGAPSVLPTPSCRPSQGRCRGTAETEGLKPFRRCAPLSLSGTARKLTYPPRTWVASPSKKSADFCPIFGNFSRISEILRFSTLLFMLFREISAEFLTSSMGTMSESWPQIRRISHLPESIKKYTFLEPNFLTFLRVYCILPNRKSA